MNMLDVDDDPCLGIGGDECELDGSVVVVEEGRFWPSCFGERVEITAVIVCGAMTIEGNVLSILEMMR